MLKTLFALMTEEQARELGRKSGREAGPGLVTFWYKKFDLENTIKAIGKVTSEYGRHESGKNASAYYSESVKAVFGMLGLDCRMEENEDQVTAYVDALPSSTLLPPLKLVAKTPR